MFRRLYIPGTAPTIDHSHHSDSVLLELSMVGLFLLQPDPTETVVMSNINHFHKLL